MKFLPIVSLALVTPLLLGGCASSPSIEEQAKLVEYETCLESARERIYWIYQVEGLIPGGGKTVEEQVDKAITQFEVFRDACSKFKP